LSTTEAVEEQAEAAARDVFDGRHPVLDDVSDNGGTLTRDAEAVQRTPDPPDDGDPTTAPLGPGQSVHYVDQQTREQVYISDWSTS
jgi:hypothetical protein